MYVFQILIRLIEVLSELMHGLYNTLFCVFVNAVLLLGYLCCFVNMGLAEVGMPTQILLR